MTLDVDTAGCDEKVESRDDLRSMLNSLVDISHLAASTSVVFEIVFEFYLGWGVPRM